SHPPARASHLYNRSFAMPVSLPHLDKADGDQPTMQSQADINSSRFDVSPLVPTEDKPADPVSRHAAALRAGPTPPRTGPRIDIPGNSEAPEPLVSQKADVWGPRREPGAR